MPIPAAFMKRGKKAAEGSTAEEKSESPAMEKGEGPEYGDAPHGKMGKKPCAACMKKGKKKGSCGCDKGGKMDAALTPMEYLDACDLGIQNRSRAYVRGVLGVREDKKCGGSGIAEGKKCNKGSVGGLKAALGSERGQTALKVAGIAAAGIGLASGGAVGAITRRNRINRSIANKAAIQEIKGVRNKVSMNLQFRKKDLKRRQEFKTSDPSTNRYNQLEGVANLSNERVYATHMREAMKRNLGTIKSNAPMSPARRRKAAKNGDAPVGLGAKMRSYMEGK